MTEIICARTTVTSVHQPCDSFRRIVLAGPDLVAASCDLIATGGGRPAGGSCRLFGACAGCEPRRDAYVKLLIPPPGLPPVDVDPSLGLREFLARPESERGWMRTYTVRSAGWTELDGESVPALTIDVVVHGDAGGHDGPGLAWARGAEVGDRVNVLVPGGESPLWSGWQHSGAAQVLAVGDETAAPAMVSVLEELRDPSRGFRGAADIVIELPYGGRLPDATTQLFAVDPNWEAPAGGVLGIDLPGGNVRLHVGRRAPSAPTGTWAAGRLASLLGLQPDEVGGFAPPPAEDPTLREWHLADAVAEDLPYVFLAGESSMVRGLRQLCVRDRGLPKNRVSFMGYWRRGQAES